MAGPKAVAATIRVATLDDAAALAEIYAPYVASTPISFELEPPSPAVLAERIATVTRTYPWLVHVVGGEVVGYAYASPHNERAAYRWSVNTTVYVRAGHHRAGVGRALYRSLLACLELQGFCAAHAGATLPNPATVALHESLGFQRVGVYRRVGYKLGAWHDVVWWQKDLCAREVDPRPPRPLAEAQLDVGWEKALATGVSA